MAVTFKPGMRIRVPWGFKHDREGRVVEVWGDPEHPTDIRVELDALDPEIGPSVLLLDPDWVTPATAA